ncbi:MAG: acetyl-CoA carboxylase biotin carboxyl carrier protein [Brevinemataceae bacterium]
MSKISDIHELYNLFSDLNLESIEISEGKDTPLTISFGNNHSTKNTGSVQSLLTSESVDSEITNVPSVSKILMEITSPALGIFERSNPKTHEYYVKLRDIVSKNQVVGHVKVLGISYDVVAPMSGKILEILIEDEQPIEYGQPIMRLEEVQDEV